ncbi:hypothetical protein ACGVWS_00855 [Enterobacteriaceae bacterium LUAb1]
MINADYPKFVYRMDKRSYTEIFRTGFQSWGYDKDILNHLMGFSTNNHTSAYIATSSDIGYFNRFTSLYGRAQRMLNNGVPEILYIYEISFKKDMISVKDFVKENNLLLHLPMNFIDRQNEYLAQYKINKHDIVRCYLYRLNTDKKTYRQAEIINND